MSSRQGEPQACPHILSSVTPGPETDSDPDAAQQSPSTAGMELKATGTTVLEVTGHMLVRGKLHRINTPEIGRGPRFEHSKEY